MNFMTCTTCKKIVQVNCTGICLGCQRGFMQDSGEDMYGPEINTPQNLEKRLEEIENLLLPAPPIANPKKKGKVKK